MHIPTRTANSCGGCCNVLNVMYFSCLIQIVKRSLLLSLKVNFRRSSDGGSERERDRERGDDTFFSFFSGTNNEINTAGGKQMSLSVKSLKVKKAVGKVVVVVSLSPDILYCSGARYLRQKHLYV